MNRILNLVLRFGTLITRFLFVFFLAKYLDPATVGYYGIFTATIAFSVLFVGAEYHTYVTRNVAKSQIEDRGRMLKTHAAVSGILYIVLLPIALMFLSNAPWPSHLALWFLPLLLLEHFNQEVFRLLIVMSQQVTASLLLFVRHGSWAIAIVIMMTVSEDTRTLKMVMLSWLVASLVAAALGIWKIYKMDFGGWQSPIDRTWAKRGLMLALPFLLATLAQRGLFTIDRYWLEALGGPEVVGAYVLFFGVASGLSVFLDAGVFSFTYPELIRLHSNGAHALALKKMRMMLYQTLALSAVFAAVAVLLLPFMLSWIGNPVYDQYAEIFPWLLLAITILAISQVPHWGLYALGDDKPILHSQLAGFTVFVVMTWGAQDSFGTSAVLLGLNSAFGVILLWKTLVYVRHIQQVLSK